MKILLTLLLFISTIFAWVGQITALKGSAKIIRHNKVLKAQPGLVLYKNDSIKTGKNTKLQIIFKDKTVVTIGRNSLVKIADYLFDTKKNSKAKFKLSYGIMKTLTGKIGKLAPQRFKVVTKNASIGIRGTYFVVETYGDIVKLGMISGVTQFTNLKTNAQYIVSKGEQLIFEIPKNKIIIKKNFIEPAVVKLAHKTNKVIKIKDKMTNSPVIQNTNTPSMKNINTNSVSPSTVAPKINSTPTTIQNSIKNTPSNSQNNYQQFRPF